MKPWEIAARVCRPMSSDEAMGLVQASHGSREMADTDPLMEAEIKEKLSRIQLAEQEERERPEKS